MSREFGLKKTAEWKTVIESFKSVQNLAQQSPYPKFRDRMFSLLQGNVRVLLEIILFIFALNADSRPLIHQVTPVLWETFCNHLRKRENDGSLPTIPYQVLSFYRSGCRVNTRNGRVKRGLSLFLYNAFNTEREFQSPSFLHMLRLPGAHAATFSLSNDLFDYDAQRIRPEDMVNRPQVQVQVQDDSETDNEGEDEVMLDAPVQIEDGNEDNDQEEGDQEVEGLVARAEGPEPKVKTMDPGQEPVVRVIEID
eukprot:TRINITY_DN8155_c0_g2_i2.p1 TRINITY_DN8155_c0_g2~~TRINITY_DN8155_c0_g2_i2.p1  ORF type:complete len:252 (-),score=21.03 TRINITY_DN8155_c0_g2_i2:258-1013(-)